MGGDPTTNVKPTKITARVQYSAALSDRPPSRNVSRPASPTKSYVSPNTPSEQPAFRPKAKVNSSATVRTTKATASNLSVESPTLRPASPTKLAPRARNIATTPTSTPKAKPVVGLSPRVQSTTTASAPVTPELRNRSYTTAENVPPAQENRNRTASVSSSLHHAASFSSLQTVAASSPLATSSSSRLTSSRSIVGLDRANSPSPSVRIRSKVTGLAKTVSSSSDNASTVSQQPSQHSYPSSRANTSNNNNITPTSTIRARAPSTSSNASGQQLQPPSSPPMPQFYPITTASPAANPHRYNSPRPPPGSIAARAGAAPTGQYVNAFQSMHNASSSPTSSPTSPANGGAKAKLSSIITSGGSGVASPSSAASSPQLEKSSLRLGSVNGGNGPFARIDAPNAIPPPPLSPPVSALSFSSRSSVSLSKSSGVSSSSRHKKTNSSTEGSSLSLRGNPTTTDLRTTLDNLLQYTAGLDEENNEVDREDKKIKAEAKSNRKIEDLEISNRSLLAINATLEATKNRQAKEIRELRRKLRESRLLLPPRTYRRVKSSLGPEDIADDEEDVTSSESSSEDEDNDGQPSPEKIRKKEEDKANRAKENSDEIYKRIKIIIDSLVKSGQEALESKPSDFGYAEGGTKGGAKVLSAEEVRDYHGEMAGGSVASGSRRASTVGGTNVGGRDLGEDGDMSFDPDMDTVDGDGDGDQDDASISIDFEQDEDEEEDPDSPVFEHPYRHLHPNAGRGDASFDTLTSEDEVEAMTIMMSSNPASPTQGQQRATKNGGVKHSSPPPPILITQPT